MKKYLVVLGALIGCVSMAGQVGTKGLHFVAPAVNGKSNVYSPEAGEIVYDYSDGHFYGYDAVGPQWIDMNSNSVGNTSSYEISNLGLVASVGSSQMTVALKQSGGSDPASGSGAVKIGFRNGTGTVGQYAQISTTGALSLVIPSGATLGSSSAAPNWVYIYAINNAGTVELAVAGSKVADEGSLINTTAISAGSSSKNVLYSDTARTDVAVRLIGRVKSTQSTAGTWATSPSEISLVPLNENAPRSFVRCNTPLSHGGSSSGDTHIRNWTNCTAGGSAITRTARTSIAADYFTINEDGVYSMHYTDHHSSGTANYYGFSLNTTQTSTNIATPATGMMVACGSIGGNSLPIPSCSWTQVLSAGDIIRFHTSAVSNCSTNLCTGTIVKVSN